MPKAPKAGGKSDEGSASPSNGAPVKAKKIVSIPTYAPGRQQNSACSACRVRRVKCNLRERQRIIEEAVEKNKSLGIQDDGINDPSLVGCTNCEERGMKCIDEFSNLRKVKLLRKGKLIKELEKTHTLDQPVAGSSKHPESSSHGNQMSMFPPKEHGPKDTAPLSGVRPGNGTPSASPAPHPQGEAPYQHQPPSAQQQHYDQQYAYNDWPFPEITLEFLACPFYRRLHLQRPIVDPADFLARFTQGDLGPVGVCLSRVLYAWAVAYGVNNLGDEPVHLPDDEQRQVYRDDCNTVLQYLFRDIDALSIMRKPSWDGVRIILYILPLATDVLTKMEIQAMYECAYSQVLVLAVNTPLSMDWSQEVDAYAISENENLLVRTRAFWYCFLHESTTVSLSGRRMVFDDEDILLFHPDSPVPRALMAVSPYYKNFVAYTAPGSNLSSALRLVNKALHNRRIRGNIDEVCLDAAFETLDACWSEFENARKVGPVGLMIPEDVERYCDGWQMNIFSYYQMIYATLLDRVTTSSPETTAALHGRVIPLVRSKCNALVRAVADIVKRQLGTSFFQYDAALVQIGTFLAATTLAESTGTEEDMVAFVSAFREMRFAYSKTAERVEVIEQVWSQRLERERAAKAIVPPAYRRLSLAELLHHPSSSNGSPSSSSITPAPKEYQPSSLSISSSSPAPQPLEPSPTSTVPPHGYYSQEQTRSELSRLPPAPVPSSAPTSSATSPFSSWPSDQPSQPRQHRVEYLPPPPSSGSNVREGLSLPKLEFARPPGSEEMSRHSSQTYSPTTASHASRPGSAFNPPS